MGRIKENQEVIDNLMYNNLEYISGTDKIYIGLLVDMSKSLAIIAERLDEGQVRYQD